MANTTTQIIPLLLAQGLMALRQTAVMPRLVNRGYESLAGEKGSTIQIPIPSAITTNDVVPAATPAATGDVAPTSVSVVLNRWKEAAFYLTDKDVLEVMSGTIPMQASEAIKSIVNTVEADIFALYKGIYGFAGTPATTPFATDLSAFTAARGVLNKQLAPKDPRFVVLDVDAEANAINLRAFQDASFRGDTAGIMEGQIGRKLGSFWTSDQNVVTHTSTPLTAGAATANGVNAIGATTLSIAKATNASPLVAGDIVQVTGDAQTYVVGTAVSLIVGNTAVAITPGLKKATAGGEVITLKATHVVNLAGHRDAIALVSRPFAAADPMGLGTFLSAIDEVSGLALRLELTREYKRTRYAFDMLYGTLLVRPDLITRIAG
jgi:coat protein Gp5